MIVVTLEQGRILFDQRYQQYIKLEKCIPKRRVIFGDDYFDTWTYRVCYRNKCWGGLLQTLAVLLKQDCREVGRLEALVVLGERI